MSLVPARRPGWLLDPRCKSGARGMAAQSRFLKRDGQNPAYRPSGIIFTPEGMKKRKQGTKRRNRTPSRLSSLLRVLRVHQKVLNAGCRWLVRLDAQAEEIGRLGIPALALLRRQGPPCGEGAPVRPRGLQRNRRQARAQGPAQPRTLVFLRGARRRIQPQLELFRGAQPGGSRSPRGRRGIGSEGLPPVRAMAMG